MVPLPHEWSYIQDLYAHVMNPERSMTDGAKTPRFRYPRTPNTRRRAGNASYILVRVMTDLACVFLAFRLSPREGFRFVPVNAFFGSGRGPAAVRQAGEESFISSISCDRHVVESSASWCGVASPPVDNLFLSPDRTDSPSSPTISYNIPLPAS